MNAQQDIIKQFFLHVSFTQLMLGTNPIAVAAPGKNGDGFSLDMATSAAALGKVRKIVVMINW